MGLGDISDDVDIIKNTYVVNNEVYYGRATVGNW